MEVEDDECPETALSALDASAIDEEPSDVAVPVALAGIDVDDEDDEACLDELKSWDLRNVAAAAATGTALEGPAIA